MMLQSLKTEENVLLERTELFVRQECHRRPKLRALGPGPGMYAVESLRDKDISALANSEPKMSEL